MLATFYSNPLANVFIIMWDYLLHHHYFMPLKLSGRRMDLMDRVQNFLVKQHEKLLNDLLDKYGIPPDEQEGYEDIVSRFLEETYGPAKKMAESIYNIEQPAILFIGEKDCPICQNSQRELDHFIKLHKDVKLVGIDYSKPQGMLCHMINQEDFEGLLPIIAMLYGGHMKKVWSGEIIPPDVYEMYYNILQSIHNTYEL